MKKILFADDYPQMVRSLALMFSMLGFKTYEACSPEEALGVFVDEHPDIAIFDYRMIDGTRNDKSGLVLAMKLSGETPIIIFSSDEQPLDTTLPHNVYWITKSAGVEVLRQKVSELLD